MAETTMSKVSEATPYIGLSASITLIITYFADLPQDVAGAITVVLMVVINYLLILLKPLGKKIVRWLER